VRAVRFLDHVIEVAILDHRQRRAELFLIHQPQTGVGLGDDGGWVKVPRPIERLSADHDPGTLPPRVVDQGAHLLELHLVVDRPELRIGLHAVAHLDGRSRDSRSLSSCHASRRRCTCNSRAHWTKTSKYLHQPKSVHKAEGSGA
jgi:hypothetical protein